MSARVIVLASCFVLTQPWIASSVGQNNAISPEKQPATQTAKQVNNAFEQIVPGEGQQSSIASFRVVLPKGAGLGERVTLALHTEVKPGWHIAPLELPADATGLATRIELSLVGLESVAAGFEASKEPLREEQSGVTSLWMEGKFTWSQQFRVTDPNYSAQGSVRFQACNDEVCHPPRKLDFAVGQSAQHSKAAPSAVGNTSDRVENRAEKAVGPLLTLELEPCVLTRVRPQIGNIASLLIFGRGTDKMVWKAKIPSGPAQGVEIYLPKSRTYSIENRASGNTIVENTATYISIDQDGDSALAEWEACAANLPVRIHDSMFRITSINVEQKKLGLQQLDMPLRGSLVGRKCPEFQFTTLDGQVVSNASIRGKVTVLDIWAVTCHNCYEGFPGLQKMQAKYSPEKLDVVLLSIDHNREFYDKLAPGLFEQYGGREWPQVIAPGGFEGVLGIGDYGFGSVVVDEAGVVRAVGVSKETMEQVLDAIFAGK